MMPAEPTRLYDSLKEKYAPALAMLGAVSQMEAAWLETENQAAPRQLLDEGLPLLDRVIRLFHTLEETTLEAWTLLQKASLLADLAGSLGPSERVQLSHQALHLVREAFNRLGDSPAPALAATKDLYFLMLETLIKVRDLFTEPGQRKALEALIQGLSAHFGECLAVDLSLREKAADQLFTVQMLETLSDLEEDPETRQEMCTASQNLAVDAYDQLRATDVADAQLEPAAALLAALKNKEGQTSAPQVTVCPQCGASSPRGTPFCSQCGARLRKELP